MSDDPCGRRRKDKIDLAVVGRRVGNYFTHSWGTAGERFVNAREVDVKGLPILPIGDVDIDRRLLTICVVNDKTEMRRHFGGFLAPLRDERAGHLNEPWLDGTDSFEGSLKTLFIVFELMACLVDCLQGLRMPLSEAVSM